MYHVLVWSPAGALTIALAAAVAMAWGGYFRWKDRARPEPISLTLAVIGGGASGAVLALLGFDSLDALGRSIRWETVQSAPLGVALASTAGIALVEELAKLAPLVLVAWFSRHFDELLDGAIYAGCSGVGFALVEVAVHVGHGDVIADLWPRILASPISHGLFTTPAGIGLAAWTLRRDRAPVAAALAAAGVGTSIALHALYNLALARSAAGPPISAAIVALTWVAFMAACPYLAALPAASRESDEPKRSGAPPQYMEDFSKRQLDEAISGERADRQAGQVSVAPGSGGEVSVARRDRKD